MPSVSDFTPFCNLSAVANGTDLCTPETCCLAFGEINYLPNFPANVFFAAVFLFLLIPNAFFGIRYKTWSFMTWVTLGLLGEAVGYAGRIMLYENIFSFNAFLVYLIPLTLAPALITASIYLCLARLINVLDPALEHTRLQPMTYTKLFVTCDIISLILQAAGGALSAIADTKAQEDTGVHIMIAGLAFQVFSLLLFIGLCTDFTIRLRNGRKTGMSWQMQGGAKSTGSITSNVDTSYESEGSRIPPLIQDSEDDALRYAHITNTFMFKAFVGTLIAATLLILTRSCYRLAELQGGFNGKLANDEVLFMILEPPLIFLSCALLITFHPGLALKGLWSMGEFKKPTVDAAAAVKSKAGFFTFRKDQRRGTYEGVAA
ncbi:Uu.00g100080.m01.CDS01 [Anthostomella pinea]|uniref:Uu.00g100080.m01.CDS01 n=1 Tax=Anthostomella pinea TaxID=933095 RepID=A0AAI8V7U8_9PEZI|nr:Uu.00g100080.m01.CDS01 [Anthostomella pinea]